MKLADVTPVNEKGRKDVKENFRPEVFCPQYQKFLKNVCLLKCLLFFENMLSTMQFSKRIQYSTLTFVIVGNMEEVCR